MKKWTEKRILKEEVNTEKLFYVNKIKRQIRYKLKNKCKPF